MRPRAERRLAARVQAAAALFRVPVKTWKGLTRKQRKARKQSAKWRNRPDAARQEVHRG